MPHRNHFPCLRKCHTYHHEAIHGTNALFKVGLLFTTDKFAGVFGMGKLEWRQTVHSAGLVVQAGFWMAVLDVGDIGGLERFCFPGKLD